MKFQIEDVTVYFPYDNIYPEQYSYMVELKRALDAKGHCLLEMPTGTGKTIALLSLITSYALSKPSNPVKLLYCTRTVHEMEKTLAELRFLHNYQVKHLGPSARILALGLSSRKNLCVNPRVVSAENRDSVDAACRKLTASWVRALAVENPNIPTCEFFENYEKAASDAVLPPGVYTLQESYQRRCRESVVVFDEAHNIDNVCIEALSVSVRMQTLEGATRNLNRMNQEIESLLKATDAGRCVQNTTGLLRGWHKGGIFLIGPVLQRRLQTENVEKEGPVTFVASINAQVGIDQKMLRFCYDRLHSLMLTLEITDTDEFLHIQTICDLATLLCCHDASLAIKPVFESVPVCYYTSGTLSPIDLYPRLLNFNPWLVKLSRCRQQGIAYAQWFSLRGSDQLPVSTKYDLRSDLEIMQHKLVFIETQDVVETTLALDNYRRACDCGRGAVFFSVARTISDYVHESMNQHQLQKKPLLDFCYITDKGVKWRKGIDFDRHYGRLVIMFGVPFQYIEQRQAAQCVGRSHPIKGRLWDDDFLPTRDIVAMTSARNCLFLRRMAQPYDKNGAMGKKNPSVTRRLGEDGQWSWRYAQRGLRLLCALSLDNYGSYFRSGTVRSMYLRPTGSAVEEEEVARGGGEEGEDVDHLEKAELVAEDMVVEEEYLDHRVDWLSRMFETV
ncbi:hypothetical protein DH2020_001549 [Rehmannia glutinosa]|uniref:DNA 5'-3' helicase n=1 Tax=Rehmannia glutinosa TaxID=99300 RepID=A0ABR0Y035_REHGL